jgi:superfamily II DNA helicase RecQ
LTHHGEATKALFEMTSRFYETCHELFKPSAGPAEIGKPAYVVFADRTLAEIARRRPAALAALRAVSGVGDHKLERYGDDVLAVVRAHAGTAP